MANELNIQFDAVKFDARKLSDEAKANLVDLKFNLGVAGERNDFQNMIEQLLLHGTESTLQVIKNRK